MQQERRATSGPIRAPVPAKGSGKAAGPDSGPIRAPVPAKGSGKAAGPEPASSSAGSTARPEEVVPRSAWSVAARLVTLFISLCVCGYEDGSRFRLCVASFHLRARLRRLDCAMSWAALGSCFP